MAMLVNGTEGDLFAKNSIIKKVKGVRLVKRLYICLDEILVNPLDNEVRDGGTNSPHVQELKNDFGRGIRYNEFLPVVEKLPVSKTYNKDNKLKFYALVDGFNRISALMDLGYTHYWFDVVEFGSDDVPAPLARYSFAMASNAHSPKLPSSDKDIYNGVARLVADKYIPNDFEKIKEYIKSVSNVTPARAHNIASKVAASTGIIQPIFIWSQTSIKRNETQAFGAVSHGRYDKEREMFGWTMLEGYHNDTFFNAISKYNEKRNDKVTHGRSYIVGHVKLPDTLYDLDERRKNTADAFDKKVEDLIAVCEYYKVHGKLPFEMIGFLPQTKDEENKGELVPLKQYSSKVNSTKLNINKADLPENLTNTTVNSLNKALNIK